MTKVTANKSAKEKFVNSTNEEISKVGSDVFDTKTDQGTSHSPGENGISQSDPFATETDMKPTSYPFHDFEKTKEITGIYLGQGPTYITDKSRGEKFYTIALLEKESRIVKLVGANKVIDTKVIQKCEAGKHLVKIVSLGVKDGDKNEYNDYYVESGPLKQPYTNFNKSDFERLIDTRKNPS